MVPVEADAPAQPAEPRQVDEDAPPGPPLTLRVAVLRLALVAGVIAVVLGIGAVNGVGPLAQVTPPDQVTDPREMLARSLQSVIDASSVHIAATLGGQVPGHVLGRSDAEVALDGTQAALDVRPQDARSHLAFVSPALGVDIEALTLWDTLSSRESGGAWSKRSLGSVVGESGIDANPLTLVARLRAWLAAPGAPTPVEADAACDAPSGRCRQVQLTTGPEAGEVLLRLAPPGAAASVGTTTTELLLLTDAATLRPAHLLLETRNASGTLDVTLRLDWSFWDWPSVIPDPPAG